MARFGLALMAFAAAVGLGPLPPVKPVHDDGAPQPKRRTHRSGAFTRSGFPARAVSSLRRSYVARVERAVARHVGSVQAARRYVGQCEHLMDVGFGRRVPFGDTADAIVATVRAA